MKRERIIDGVSNAVIFKMLLQNIPPRGFNAIKVKYMFGIRSDLRRGDEGMLPEELRIAFRDGPAPEVAGVEPFEF